MLTWIFTAVYYLGFHLFICFIFNNFLDNLFEGIAAESFLAIFCMVICFFISVGLGQFTEKKIKEKHLSK